MEHHPSTFFPTSTTAQTANQTESDRLLVIAEKLLQTRDLTGSREFALLAQETETLSEGSDQILAITDVLLAAENHVNNTRRPDWYSILQTDPRSEPDLVRKNYRRLAPLLHPDKNNYSLAESAFKLVADAWAVLSDPLKRTSYDNEVSLFSRVEVRPEYQQQEKQPVRPSSSGVGVVATTTPTRLTNTAGMMSDHSRGVGIGTNRLSNPNFWTTCPYCYLLYEYPKVYKECCIRCQNCERAFQAVAITSLPSMVPGKEAYYCCWGFFPLGFSLENGGGKEKKIDTDIKIKIKINNNGNGNVNVNADNVANAVPNINDNADNVGLPNWMPGMFTGGGADTNRNNNAGAGGGGVKGVVDFSDGGGSGVLGNAMAGMSALGAKKRGRPKKNPLGV